MLTINFPTVKIELCWCAVLQICSGTLELQQLWELSENRKEWETEGSIKNFKESETVSVLYTSQSDTVKIFLHEHKNYANEPQISNLT